MISKPSMDQVSFRLIDIKTRSFSIYDENYEEGKAISLKSDISFGLNLEIKGVGCFCSFEYLIDNKPFIKLEVVCGFDVQDEYWDGLVLVNDQSKISFPSGFMKHLAVLTIGTARGILHTKTENSVYNKFILPTINVNDFVKEDQTFLVR